MNKRNTSLVIRAIGYSMLSSAIFHIILLVINAVLTTDYYSLNVFTIVGISLFFKQFTVGVYSFVVSYVVFIGVVFFWYKQLVKQSKTTTLKLPKDKRFVN